MVIFDFDQTLVDTSSVEKFRSTKNWGAVMAQASSLPVYGGITELLAELDGAGHTLAIVTKSPDMVPRAFIRAHNWPIKIVVGHHQVRVKKPNPEGLLLAMSKANVTPNTTYHVGDHSQDTEASRRAGVVALGSAWGCSDISDLVKSKPDRLFHTVDELGAFLKSAAVSIS
ncbi:HAD family hydrolase [Sphingorhabdus contaminans]|uniref:phosphoglycolate phosphatase n=1 Tax=Sphingorhabdus contaminans TaxID=1343899 RepID=A0A553WAC0_9SPHN|nr:HAD-IA family hydrolase [Sphingorhabdus contaminans]TSB01621.1 HAD family hydrolase [Sphingorhabdus contaminans]